MKLRAGPAAKVYIEAVRQNLVNWMLESISKLKADLEEWYISTL